MIYDYKLKTFKNSVYRKYRAHIYIYRRKSQRLKVAGEKYFLHYVKYIGLGPVKQYS